MLSLAMRARLMRVLRFRKDRLKKNPMVSNDELNEVSSGLGDEAAREFSKGGLGKEIGKAFD